MAANNNNNVRTLEDLWAAPNCNDGDAPPEDDPQEDPQDEDNVCKFLTGQIPSDVARLITERLRDIPMEALRDPNAILHQSEAAYRILGVSRAEVEGYKEVRFLTDQIPYEVVSFITERLGVTPREAFRIMFNGIGFEKQLILYILTWLVLNQLLPTEETVRVIFHLTDPALVLLIEGSPRVVNRRAELREQGHLLPTGIVEECVRYVWVHGKPKPRDGAESQDK
jgi:hypothetical protein